MSPPPPRSPAPLSRPPVLPPERAARAEATFNSALERPAAERAAYVTQTCGEDEELRERVQGLLAAHEGAGEFLKTDASLSPEVERELARLKPEESGQMIGPYKLREQIGEGGFGTVWMAEQEKPVRRRVALKIIKLGMDTKEVIARFEQERQALAMMEHPNIAKVLDAGATETGRPFFVMELVRGIPITHYCDQHKLATIERLRLFVTVCHALQHAHHKGIIHRDLKPTNILVAVHDGAPVPKVIDFGVAKATQQRLTELTVFTQFEQMIGTPLYMSPEQAEMSGLDVDTRSDIYSLGVLLYELLTGRTPFDAKELMRRGYQEIRRMIREQEPPKPSTAVSSMAREAATTVAHHQQLEPPKLVGLLRGDLDWIVMKALEKDRSRRYETANGFAMDIERHLAGEPILARPPTTFYRLGKLVRRNKLAFGAAAGVMLALLAGAGFSIWLARQAEGDAKLASAALDDLQKTAPAFVEQARAMAAREEFDGALAKLDTAAKLRPDVAEYRVARGDIFQCQLRLAEAAAEYRAALQISPEHARAKTNAALCDRLLAVNSDPAKLAPDSLRELAVAMEAERRPAAQRLAVARQLGEEKAVIRELWIERLADLPLPPERPLANRLSIRADGLLALDLQGTQVTDLALLAGMPLGELDATGCGLLTELDPIRELPLTVLKLADSGVTDLSPLAALSSLKTLDLSGAKVRDLAPLQGLGLTQLTLRKMALTSVAPLSGMPLESLDLEGTPVSDFSALRGLPLRSLNLTGTGATDLSPLAGSPLEDCTINDTNVRDLSFLKGAPLKMLSLCCCSEVRNYAALAGCTTLEKLTLPTTLHNLPLEELDAITALRGLPALRQIIVGHFADTSPEAAAPGQEVLSARTAVEFWKKWEALMTVAKPLRAAGHVVNARVRDDGTLSLNLYKQPIEDLSMLAGAPISYLDMIGTKVRDLAPLRTMKLKSLEVGSLVSDLSPLRGLPLNFLNITSTGVTDLTPLEGMPLTRFYADGSTATDFTPLAKIATLTSILLPLPKPGAPPLNIEPLRSLPKLKRLSFGFDQTVGPVSTAQDFWKHWDGLGWLRALQDGKLKFTAEQLADGRWSVSLLGEKRFNDCSIFKGAPIAQLNIDTTSVVDLSPLRDIPLEVLDAGQTPVADVSTLRGSAMARTLQVLSLFGTAVADYSPVGECENLRWLNACRSAVQDINFLRALKNCPAVGLSDTPVTDISALSEMPALRTVFLPWGARDVEKLRQSSELRFISYVYQAGKPTQTAEEFWQIRKDLPWFAELGAKGITVKSERRSDGLWSVTIRNPLLEDLSSLRGSPLHSLDIMDAKVASLEPLRGMPLTHLAIGNSKVTDLSPLAGMKLEYIQAGALRNLTDISVLRGMPLRVIYIEGVSVGLDLAPLADCETLEIIRIPKGAKSIERLRQLPRLRRIGYDFAGKNERTETEEFWAAYDRAKKK